MLTYVLPVRLASGICPSGSSSTSELRHPHPLGDEFKKLIESHNHWYHIVCTVAVGIKHRSAEKLSRLADDFRLEKHMARRDRGLLNDLALLPWWVSVCVAIFCFITLKFVLPVAFRYNPILESVAKGFSSMAHWVGGVFLIPAVISAFNSARKKKQLNRQTSVESIRNLSWKEFEELIGEAYRRKGYTVMENASGGSDGGIDLRVERGDQRLIVQCKQWRSARVGVTVVREMYGVMMHEHADGVVIVTSGTFTEEASSFASDKPIELIEGHQLYEMIANVQPRSAPSYSDRRPPAKLCPRCGNALVMREAKRGSRAGSRFWGCSSYPNCKHTESVD